MAADSSSMDRFASMGLAFFTRINPNLLVPVVIVFLLMRLKSVCNVSLRIISGLKMFTKKMFAPPPSNSSNSETKAQRDLSPGEIIDKAIARLHLTMIEIQDTPSILHLMRKQLFYDTYDSMIYLCLSSLLAYGWSLAYSCYSPQSSSTSSYCWIVIIILVLMLYSVQILLQIMYMTGFTAKETRLALAMGAAAGALSVALFVMHASYVSDSTAEAIAIHLNALVMQLNGSVVLLSTGQLKPIIYIALSALLSLVSMGLVLPAVRFASTFNKIVSGSGTTPHLTFYRKAMLFSDIVLPFLVAILYSSAPDLLFGIHGGSNTGHSGSSSNSSSSSYLGSIDAVMSCSSSSDDATCLGSDDAGMGMGVGVAGYSKYPSDHHPYESGLLVAQLVVVLLMVFTRWSNLQAHLQTHLDSLVHLVAAQIIAPNGVSEESIATLQLKVKLCTGYLMAATSQYVAVPLFAAGCALLLHLSSPTGTGACYGLYSLAGLDPSSLTASIDYMGHRNTTAIAIATASNPYFTDVLVSLAGISMVGPRDYSTAIMATDFFVKLSGIYGLPHAAAVSLCRSLVFIHSLLWGLCYSAAILLWRFHPSTFVGSSSSSR